MAIKPADTDHATDSEGAILSEINITPLVDVFLVLLIIFMVTSSVMSQLGVDVKLPRASAGLSEAQSDGVVVTLFNDGGVRVNDSKVTAGDQKNFSDALKAAFSKTSSRLVVLEGDRQAFLGTAIEIMDVARKAGADKFAIATSSEYKPQEQRNQ
ncbi:MAG: biopolymer transporter ExbD [Bdellovibrionota bacterium]